MCTPSTPLGFSAKSLVFLQKGVEVENKGGGQLADSGFGRERGALGCFFKGTWNC